MPSVSLQRPVVPEFAHQAFRWTASFIACAGILCGAMVAFALFSHRRLSTTLSNGTIVKVTPPTTLASLCTETRCKVDCRTKSGSAGTINLLEDSDSCLAFMMPASDGEGLLFLYYADVHFYLMRVNPEHETVAFPTGSYLPYIVLSSPWEIEEGTRKDWAQIRSYLENVPQEIFDRQSVTMSDLGFVQLHFEREKLLSEVNREINNSRHGWAY